MHGGGKLFLGTNLFVVSVMWSLLSLLHKMCKIRKSKAARMILKKIMRLDANESI